MILLLSQVSSHESEY